MSEPRPPLPDELFAALVESAPDAMVIVDHEGIICLANGQAERLFAYHREEMVGRHVEALIPGRFRDVHVGHRERYAADPHPRAMGEGRELFGARKDGSEFPVEISLSPIEVGGQRWVAAAIRDATARRQVEARLRDQQHRFEALLEAAPDAMVIVAGDGDIILVNQQAERMFGHARGAMVGRKVEMLIPDRFGSQHVGHRARYAQDPRPRPMGQGLELFGKRADGTEFPIEISLSPLQQGGQDLVIAAVRDITERKHLEAQEQRARAVQGEMERLRERDSFKTQFINNAAHELNTPLTPLLMQLKILELEGDENLSAMQKQSLATLRRNGERFARLVQDLLDAGRYQGGRLSLQLRDVELSAIVDESIKDFSSSFEEEGIAIRAALDEGPIVHADPMRIRQVMDNLISNALKFSAGKDIDVRMAHDGGAVTIEVQDHGYGLTRDQLGRLFEPFSRVHDDAEAPPGTGLGLYLSKAIIEMHGGDISATSPGKGQGATFSVRLPLHVER